MRKNVLVSAAIAVVLMANVIFSVDAQAVSRTTTVEISGVGRTADDAGNGQVLGARRGEEVSKGIEVSTVTNQEALSEINTVEKVATVINTYVRAIVNNNSTEQTGNSSASTLSEVKAENVSVVGSMELKLEEGVTASAENPLYVSFSVPGVTANTKAWILHFGRNGWEVVPTTVSEGKVIGMFTSFSPVTIIVDKSTLNGSVLGANRKTSPRTGDNFWLIIIAGAGVVALSAIGLQKKFLHD
jgi:hypothetical protein